MNEDSSETRAKKTMQRVKYPMNIFDQGLIVRKFEKDYTSV